MFQDTAAEGPLVFLANVDRYGVGIGGRGASAEGIYKLSTKYQGNWYEADMCIFGWCLSKCEQPHIGPGVIVHTFTALTHKAEAVGSL